MKDFIIDFYIYDLTRIIHNDDSSDESDLEIDLEDEKENDKEKVKALVLVIDDEVTSKLLHQEGACIIIDND